MVKYVKNSRGEMNCDTICEKIRQYGKNSSAGRI